MAWMTPEEIYKKLAAGKQVPAALGIIQPILILTLLLPDSLTVLLIKDILIVYLDAHRLRIVGKFTRLGKIGGGKRSPVMGAIPVRP
jgi:hypothetical protein